ncbi:putative DNA/RNA polymerase superfamily protein, partial [Trifolium medium]|nr:putative DNA/RNA polymerase superfamily protein [Trifolium medium]
MLKLPNPFLEEIKECQKKDKKMMEKLVLINEGNEVDFGVDGNEIIRYRGRVCVPDAPELKKMI